MDDRDGWTPVPLARDTPVVQPVVHLGLAASAFGQPGGDGRFGVGHGHSVEATGVHYYTVARISLGERGVRSFTLARYHAYDGQLHRLCEVEISLVVTGDRHDGPGSVLHEHVVRDPDGNGLTGGRVQAITAGRHTRLGLLDLLASHEILGRRLLLVGRDRLRLLLTGDFVQ